MYGVGCWSKALHISTGFNRCSVRCTQGFFPVLFAIIALQPYNSFHSVYLELLLHPLLLSRLLKLYRAGDKKPDLKLDLKSLEARLLKLFLLLYEFYRKTRFEFIELVYGSVRLEL
jgi:hypothetical protein